MSENLNDWLGLVVPEEGINLVQNPSFELGVGKWTTNTPDEFSRERGGQFGAYRALWRSTSATSYAQPTFTSHVVPTGGSHYSAQMWLEASTPNARLGIFDGSTLVASVNHSGSGLPELLQVSTSAPIAGGNNVYVRLHDTSSSGWTDMWMDGVQVEASAYPTTYCDGEQEGCRWLGADHSSPSLRPFTTRLGGRPRTFRELGVRVRGMLGVGASTQESIQDRYALLPGSQYQGVSVPARVITLTCMLTGISPDDLLAKRDALISLLLGNAVQTQPLWLTYGRGEQMRRIRVYYEGGLEFGEVSKTTEAFPLRLLAPDPYWESTHDLSVATTTNVVYRKIGESGTLAGDSIGVAIRKTHDYGTTAGGLSDVGWSVPTAASDDITSIDHVLYGPDGTLYVAGEFSVIGGVAATNLARFDGVSWSAMSVGVAASSVLDMAIDVSGDVILVGSFTDLGGVTGVNYVGRYLTATDAFQAVQTSGTALNNIVRAVTVERATGNIFIIGDFTGKVAYIGPSGGRFGAGITILSGDVFDIGEHPNGMIYMVGDFTNATLAVGSADYAAYRDMSGVCHDMGATETLYKLAFARDGTTYATGRVASNTSLWKYNGASWSELDFISDTDPDHVYEMKVGPDGVVWLAVDASSGDTDVNFAVGSNPKKFNVKAGQNLVRFNGIEWGDIDAQMYGGMIRALDFNEAGDMAIGATGPAVHVRAAAGPLDVTAKAPTPLRIKTESLAGRLVAISNYTTQRDLRFMGLSLHVGPVDIQSDPKNIFARQGSLRSLASRMASDSNVGGFVLVPGRNRIGLYAMENEDTAVDSGYFILIWRERFQSVDDIPNVVPA